MNHLPRKVKPYDLGKKILALQFWKNRMLSAAVLAGISRVNPCPAE